MNMYYVKDAKWIGDSGRGQYTMYPDLAQARIGAIRLLKHPYYDYDGVVIYTKHKHGVYKYHSAVRNAIGGNEGPNEDIPMGNVRFVYRTYGGMEHPCKADGSVDMSKHWKPWFEIEYARY